MYAFDATDARHPQAKDFLENGAQQRRLVLSAQNLGEFCRVATEKWPVKSNIDEVYAAASAFSLNFPIAAYGHTTVLKALDLKKESRTHFWDALLAATMRENGIDTIYTENVNDFAKIPGIQAVNPFEQTPTKGI